MYFLVLLASFTAVLPLRNSKKDGPWRFLNSELAKMKKIRDNELAAVERFALQPRLASIARLERLVHILTAPKMTEDHKRKMPRLVICVQMTEFDQWPDMLLCLQNIINGAALEGLNVDVFVTVTFDHAQMITMTQSHEFAARLQAEAPPSLRLILYTADESTGMAVDDRIFIQQLALAQELSLDYELLVKVHTMKDLRWRDLMIQDVCGSVTRVQSTIQQFMKNEKLRMIGPLNFTWSKGSSIKNIGFGLGYKGFNDKAKKQMKRLWSLAEKPLPSKRFWTMVAGSMYWVRADQALWNEVIVPKVPTILANCASQEGCGAPAGLETLIPTLAATRGTVFAGLDNRGQ